MITTPPINVAITAMPTSTADSVVSTSSTCSIAARGLLTVKLSSTGGTMPWRSRSSAVIAATAGSYRSGSSSCTVIVVR